MSDSDISNGLKRRVWRLAGGRKCPCWFRTLGGELTKGAQSTSLSTDPGQDPPIPHLAEVDVYVLGQNVTGRLSNANDEDVNALYQPLKPWQTRIVTIPPGRPNEPLRCKLWTADLIDRPGVAVSGTSDIVTYTALSYSWGPSPPTRSIRCNNVKVLVNDSLASALRDLRQAQGEVRIWCDGLCINQSDAVEKAQQVRNMLRIFEKAELVIAWIGLPDKWTRPLFQALSQDLVSVHEIRRQPSQLHDLKCLRNVSNIIRAAGEHFRRPWFRRTWVRQEVFGASALAVYCGGHRISLDEIITATEQLVNFEQQLRAERMRQDDMILPPNLPLISASERLSLLVPPSFSTLVNSYQHAGIDRHDYEPPRQRLRYSAHWLRVLNEGADFETTDPCDKVYGVLGIITSPTTKWYVESRPDIRLAEFPISYAKPVSEVYQDVVKHLINLNRNLDVLQVFEDRRNRATDLPSWVTDWRQSTTRSIMQCAPDLPNERKRIGFAPIQDLNDLGRLKLEGVTIGGPLIEVSARGPRDRDIHHPPLACMDPNYSAIVESDCFVWGTFSAPAGLSIPSRANEPLLVPRAAKLDDIRVALVGSSCFFLLRPLKQGKYKFLGPVISDGDGLFDWSIRLLPQGRQTFMLV